MKNSFLGIFSLSICLYSQYTFAAISEKSVLEILSLPNMNAKEILITKSDSSKVLRKIAFMDEQPMKLRWKSLITFVEMNPGNSVDILNQAAGHEQWFMRNAALVAATNYDPTVAMDLAKKLIKDKALVVRSAAVDAYIKIEPNDIRELFWKEIKEGYNFKNNQSLWVREEMISYLAQTPMLGEKAQFESLIVDSSDEIQKIAKSALNKISDQNSFTIK